MDKTKKKPLSRAASSSVVSIAGTDEQNCTRKPTKIERVLTSFIDGWCGHRFQAARQLHDHALHSTVSTIQNQHGIRIDRETVTVNGYQGAKTTVAKYWLPEDQKARAEELLEHFQQRRGFRRNEQ